MTARSLAGWRFRQIDAAHGGPIADLNLCELTVGGVRHFQANARLRPELVAWKTGGTVFSDATGSGTDISPMVARHKAISEAIERWAQMDRVSARCGDYGFDMDPSSNGMAAFPGWRARATRPFALLEAAERFNLLQWWEGRLPAVPCASLYPGITCVALCSDAPGITILSYAERDGIAAYGHAAAFDARDAQYKALTELERHHAAMRCCRLVQAGHARSLSARAHPIEERSVYFSSPEGHAHFLERLATAPKRGPLKPRLIFDGEIPGPWSRYAPVWRVSYQPPTDRFLSSDSTYFYW